MAIDKSALTEELLGEILEYLQEKEGEDMKSSPLDADEGEDGGGVALLLEGGKGPGEADCADCAKGDCAVHQAGEGE